MRKTGGEDGMNMDDTNNTDMSSTDDLFSTLVMSIVMASLLAIPTIVAMGHAMTARNMLDEH
jgi:hypothetical protein